MNSGNQIRIYLLALIFTAVVLVLVRVILVTAFPNKQKDSTQLPLSPVQMAKLIKSGLTQPQPSINYFSRLDPPNPPYQGGALGKS
jgi:hypothetical protein